MEITDGFEMLLVQNWRQLNQEQAEIMFYTVDSLAAQERQRVSARKPAVPALRLVYSKQEPQ